MKRQTLLAIVTFGLTTTFASAGEKTNQVTFHRDVLPILQKNCQTCHRPGEAAPMALLTYEQTRPWAQAIVEAVLLRKMPPWTAEPGVGRKFRNERRLEKADIDTLKAWVNQGAPEGKPVDAPPPAEFVEGWIMGEPDKVWQLPEPYSVPASGTIEYTYYIIPNAFPEDTWVESAEIRPDARSVVHHIIAYVRPSGSTWLSDYEPHKFFVPVDRKQREQRPPNVKPSDWREWLAGYAPGYRPRDPDGKLAKFFPGGSDLIFELHYTADGNEVADRSSVGIRTASKPPARRLIGGAALNTKFKIPAGAPNHRVDSSITLKQPATLLDLTPHMHLRGKSFEYRAVYPTGETEVLLRVPKYDFNWQITYELAEPIPLPKGTRIECTAHFDNSPNNPYNPNPAEEVGWGDQSWEEMMIGFFGLAIDRDQDPDDLYVKPAKKKAKNETSGGE